MKKSSRRSPSRGSRDLRKRAEDRVRGGGRPPEDQSIDPEARRLMHELEVHRVELELQNDELRSARAEIEAALARYTELFDFAPLGYAVIELDATIQEINHVGARLLGRERRRLVGARFESLLGDSDQAAFADLIRKAVITESKQSAEFKGTLSAGTVLDLAVTAVVRPGAGATILLIFEDVTARKAREKKLAETEKALREEDLRKDEFLAALSHELRNPLGAIQASVFLLTRQWPDEVRSRKSCAVIERQVAHLARLVDDLLDVTRIKHGKIELHKHASDLGDLLRSTLDDHRASFERSGVRLEAELDKGAFWLHADPARIVQVVSNLLANAEKFTPSGGTVAVTLRRENARAILRVSDTGAGIAPETLPQVFEPFAQAPQTIDRARGGLGLGLALVKGLVERHGGTVGIYSEGRGRGTEVTVSLPLGELPIEARPSPPEQRTLHSGRRVLLIEDNHDAAESLGKMLEFWGHEVRLAFDGPSGVKLARSALPDVVICDIGLPEMNGYAVAKALRKVAALKQTYLIALSGYARPEDRRLASDAGFDEHMTKPPIVEELGRLIAEGPDEKALKAPTTVRRSSTPPSH